MNKKWRRFSLIALILVFLICLPTFTKNPYTISVWIMILINIALALSLYPILKTGQISLAHAGFMAIGAYTAALLIIHLRLSFWIVLPIAGITSCIISLPIGYLTLRLKGLYFLGVTFALNEIIRLIVVGWSDIFGGFNGLVISSAASISLPILPDINFSSKITQYYFILIITIIIFTIIYRINKSRFGIIFNAIEQNTDMAESLGIKTMAYKILAFSLGCFLSGIVGVYYVQYHGMAHPSSFNVWQSMYILIYNQVGGLGSLAGPIIGAITLTSIGEYLVVNPQIKPLFFGGIMVVIMIFLPGGIYEINIYVKKIIDKITYNRNKT